MYPFFIHCHHIHCCLLSREKGNTRLYHPNVNPSDPFAGKSLPPERVQWAAVLVGGWITEPSGLVNNNGIVLKYKKAIRTQKKICLTEGFRNGHLEISALIVDSIDFHKPKNGWRITEDDSKAHFVLDTSDNAVNGNQKMYSKSSFLSRILQLDMEHSGQCTNSN